MATHQSDIDRFRPIVHRRDRRWEIYAGSKRFAIVLSDHRTSAATASFQIIHHSTKRPASRTSVTRAIGAVLALIAAVVTIGIATQSTRASAGGSYIVSVPVPQRATSEKPAVVAGSVFIPPRRAIPAAAKTPDFSTKARVDARGTATVADDSDPQASGFATRQEAIAAALKTGTFQQWTGSSGDERGFIVAGPTNNGCRDLSILVRLFGGDDKVETRHECAKDAVTSAKRAR